MVEIRLLNLHNLIHNINLLKCHYQSVLLFRISFLFFDHSIVGKIFSSRNAMDLPVLDQWFFLKLTENEAGSLCFSKQRFDFSWWISWIRKKIPLIVTGKVSRICLSSTLLIRIFFAPLKLNVYFPEAGGDNLTVFGQNRQLAMAVKNNIRCHSLKCKLVFS